MYETHCVECVVDGVKMAMYVGETARSAKERFSEHWDDAMKQKQDSHIYKHWRCPSTMVRSPNLNLRLSHSTANLSIDRYLRQYR